ncbi:MAG: hypothetical protein ACJ77K_08495 [Bacteroidia bacterium]
MKKFDLILTVFFLLFLLCLEGWVGHNYAMAKKSYMETMESIESGQLDNIDEFTGTWTTEMTAMWSLGSAAVLTPLAMGIMRFFRPKSLALIIPFYTLCGLYFSVVLIMGLFMLDSFRS